MPVRWRSLSCRAVGALLGAREEQAAGRPLFFKARRNREDLDHRPSQNPSISCDKLLVSCNSTAPSAVASLSLSRRTAAACRTLSGRLTRVCFLQTGATNAPV
jgi:hypothetical protein